MSTNDEKLPKENGPEGNDESQTRRAFLRDSGIVMVAGAMAIPPSLKDVSTTSSGPGVSLNLQRYHELLRDSRTAQEFTAATRELAKSMAEDPIFAANLLENIDCVQLLNLFDQHRKELETVVGRVDGRTKEGRYIKMLTAAELFDGVAGLDGVKFMGASGAFVGMDPPSAQGQSSCSGCDAGGSATLGCCITHFWGWSSSGSCSPCS